MKGKRSKDETSVTHSVDERPDPLTHIQKLFDQGQYSSAAKELALAQRENPDNPELQLIGAKLDYFSRRFNAALQKLIKVTQALPKSIDAHHLLGVILSQTGQYDSERHAAAVQSLERAY